MLGQEAALPLQDGCVLGTHPSPFIAFVENPEAQPRRLRSPTHRSSAWTGACARPDWAGGPTTASGPRVPASELWPLPAFAPRALPSLWALIIPGGGGGGAARTPACSARPLIPAESPQCPSLSSSPAPLSSEVQLWAPPGPRSTVCQTGSLLTAWGNDRGREGPLGSAEHPLCAQSLTSFITGSRAKYRLFLRKPLALRKLRNQIPQ